MMKLGFVGAGTIAEAVVNGVLSSACPIQSILVSPRNAVVAARLAARHTVVRVAESNQAVIDSSDTVFLAIRPQIAKDVLRTLSFRKGQNVVSFVAATPFGTMREWIDQDVVLTQAIPLPFVALRRGVTAVFPPTPAIVEFFDLLGTSIPISSEQEFDVAGVASAMMGQFFGLLEIATGWFADQGMPPEKARAYLTPLISSLAQVADESGDKSLAELRAEYSTNGGVNEQLFAAFCQEGGALAVSRALDQVLKRIRGQT